MSEFGDIMKTIGKYKIYIFLFFMILIGIFVLFLSIQSFKFDDSKLYSYKAKITDVSCREQINNTYNSSRISFGCNLTLEFETNDNKKITKKYYKKESNIKYEKDDQIDIFYNHNNEEILESNPKNYRYIYLIISIICLFLAGIVYKYRNDESLRYIFGLNTLFNK